MKEIRREVVLSLIEEEIKKAKEYSLKSSSAIAKAIRKEFVNYLRRLKKKISNLK